MGDHLYHIVHGQLLTLAIMMQLLWGDGLCAMRLLGQLCVSCSRACTKLCWQIYAAALSSTCNLHGILQQTMIGFK